MSVANQLTDTQIVEDVIGTLSRYGWNVDRRSLSPVLVVIMQKLKAHQDVAEVTTRYLNDPELLAIDTANTHK